MAAGHPRHWARRRSTRFPAGPREMRRRCFGTRIGCRTMYTIGSRHQPCGMHLDATDMQGGADGLAEIAERGHGWGSLPTAVAAGRRIGSGNSDRAGAAGRGSRRREGAVFVELGPSSA